MDEIKRPKNISDIKPPHIIARAMWFLEDYLWGPFNLIDRIERVVTAIRFWDRGHQFALLRANKGGSHLLRETSQILAQYHVPIWGRTHNSKCMFFHVKRRQMRWAAAIMRNHGVTLVDKKSGDIIYQDSGPRYTPWSEGGGSESEEQPRGMRGPLCQFRKDFGV